MSAPVPNAFVTALAEANRTGRPVSFRVPSNTRQPDAEYIARPDGAVTDRDGRVVYQPGDWSQTPGTPPPSQNAAPWESRRLRLEFDARTAGHLAFAAALLGFGYAGLRVGEATGRHFQWTLIGLSLGSFAGDVLRDRVVAERRREERKEQGGVAQQRSNAIADAVREGRPVPGGRVGYNAGSYGSGAPIVDLVQQAAPKPLIIRGGK